jgi:hypothetical protein
MPTLMPFDDNLHPIPVLRFKEGGAHRIEAGAVSQRNATPFDSQTRVVGIFATGPVFLRTGGSGVSATATDHFFPENVYYDLALGDGRRAQHSHLAVVAASGDCTVYISEKE